MGICNKRLGQFGVLRSFLMHLAIEHEMVLKYIPARKAGGDAYLTRPIKNPPSDATSEGSYSLYFQDVKNPVDSDQTVDDISSSSSSKTVPPAKPSQNKPVTVMKLAFTSGPTKEPTSKQNGDETNPSDTDMKDAPKKTLNGKKVDSNAVGLGTGSLEKSKPEPDVSQLQGKVRCVAKKSTGGSKIIVRDPTTINQQVSLQSATKSSSASSAVQSQRPSTSLSSSIKKIRATLLNDSETSDED